MLIAVDVDGTIHMDLDFPGADRIRPNHNLLAAIRRFQADGHTVVLWSANGADYAQTVAAAVGLTVEGYFPKPPTRPITVDSAKLVLGAVPDLMIDDKPTESAVGIPYLRP